MDERIKAGREMALPEGAECRLSATGAATVYVYANGAGQPCARGFYGRSVKPAFAFRFRDMPAREAKIEQFFAGAEQSAARLAARHAERRAKLAQPQDHLKVGDILEASWGYDQTNIDHFQVVKLVGKRMVEIRKIGQQSHEDGFMQGECVPVRDAFLKDEKPLRRRVNEDGSVKIFEWGCWARKKDSRTVGGVECFVPRRWTAYA